LPEVTVIEVPQWQGSSSATAHRLREGADRLAGLIPAGCRTLVEAGDEPGTGALTANAVRTRSALERTRGRFPVTVGGDCGVELEPIGMAVRRHGARLAVVWFDAHGDLNTPVSSPSGAFHGMVLRTLLGEGPEGLVPDRPLRPEQVILAGVRALDPAEREYAESAGLRLVTTPAELVQALAGADAAYVHIDLDVLDPAAFASVGAPEPDGLSPDRLVAMVRALAGRVEVAGLGITEYEPSRPEDQETLARIVPALVGACRSSVVHQVERRAIAAWPAEVVHERDGWLLRHTPGVRRRRSNSAVPPQAWPATGPRGRGTAGAPGDPVIDHVEAFYRERGRPVVIQLSPADEHGGLDAMLAGRGYRRDAPTVVLTAFTADVIAATEPAPADVADGPESWVRLFAELDEHPDSAVVSAKVLSRIAPPAAFVSVAAAGMGVFAAESGWAGVFAMATSPERRRQGIGAAVLGAGARWAERVGAHRLYLQVETDNEPARALYARTGFTWSHEYHYRIAE
jgi:arginase family enzyme/GNAT superfamily N-acetyltransferase